MTQSLDFYEVREENQEGPLEFLPSQGVIMPPPLYCWASPYPTSQPRLLTVSEGLQVPSDVAKS